MKKLILIIISVLTFVLISCNGNNNDRIQTSGNIESINVVVSSKVNGEVIQILKDEGELISVGDTVLIIDPVNYELRLAEANAVMEGVEAQLQMLKTGARKEDITQAEEIVKQANINFDLAKSDFERMGNLYDSKSITQKQYEDSKARYDIASAQLKSAQENLKKMINLARPEELKQAEANLNRAVANVNLIKKSISDCYVTSPSNGFIVKKFIEKGETVNAMSSLFQVSDLSQVNLVIYVSETELGKVKLNQSAEITTDSFPDKKYTGRVSYISPNAEFTPKNIQTQEERTKLVFAVKIKIDNPEFELKDGMPADAVIIL